MNEYKLNVDFAKGRISTNLRRLVQNDYNTTKLNFTFDKEGRVLFKMLYPDGTQYVDEIQNNELVFGAGILNQEGTYEYEIALYTEDGRLTDHAIKSFEVRSELVDTDELVEPDDRVPVLDKLINDVETIKTDVEEGKYNGKNGVDGKTPNISIGTVTTLEPGAEAQVTQTGTIEEPVFNFALPSGEKGEAGGVSLEEVTEITGNPEELQTESKQIVPAINEILSSGSGTCALYSYRRSNSSDFSQYGTSFNNNDKTMLGNILTDAYKKGLNNIRLNIVPNSISSYSYNFDTQSSDKIQDKPTRIWWFGVGNRTRYVKGSMFYLNTHQITTSLSWDDNGVCTVISGSFYDTRPWLMTLDNEYIYTPTGDYHPATKKYVDDAIGALGDGIQVLTDETILAQNLEPGYYIISGASKYQYGTNSSVYFSLQTDRQYPLIVTPGGLGNYSYIYNGDNLAYMTPSEYLAVNYNNLPKKTQVLTKTNTSSFTPTDDYHPATKKYVDDAIAASITTVLAGEY